MREFQLTKRVIIGALVVLLLADGALAYFNLKMSGPRDTRELVLTMQTRELALVKKDVEGAAEIRKKLPKILNGFDEFESTLLPASKGYSVIMQEIDEYARETHLIVDERKFREKDVKGRNLTELDLEARVSGDYNGIVHFLNDLQRSKRVYIVDSLDVETEPGGQPATGALRVNLRMRTYFRKA
jgi:Tfp pilus assembly protein PilO